MTRISVQDLEHIIGIKKDIVVMVLNCECAQSNLMHGERNKFHSEKEASAYAGCFCI